MTFEIHNKLILELNSNPLLFGHIRTLTWLEKTGEKACMAMRGLSMNGIIKIWVTYYNARKVQI